MRSHCFAILAVTLSLARASELSQWMDAHVLYAHHDFAQVPNIAGERGVGFSTPTAHETFDLDAEAITYTVDQWVVPQQMLRLPEGALVQFKIEAKSILLKLPNGKTRKLRLIAAHPKH